MLAPAASDLPLDPSVRTTPISTAAAGNPWARLQELLARLKTGDTITIDGVSAATGLAPESVDAVLRGLTRAGLFERRDGSTFVRKTLYTPPMTRGTTENGKTF